jgi:hypothetical protein
MEVHVDGSLEEPGAVGFRDRLTACNSCNRFRDKTQRGAHRQHSDAASLSFIRRAHGDNPPCPIADCVEPFLTLGRYTEPNFLAMVAVSRMRKARAPTNNLQRDKRNCPKLDTVSMRSTSSFATRPARASFEVPPRELAPRQISFLVNSMAKENALEARRLNLLDITLVSAVAHLPEAPPVERRNVAARRTLLRRIRSEFEEMPGLSLTLAQAARLFGISPEASSRILAQFAEEGLLSLSNDRRYILRLERP